MAELLPETEREASGDSRLARTSIADIPGTPQDDTAHEGAKSGLVEISDDKRSSDQDGHENEEVDMNQDEEEQHFRDQPDDEDENEYDDAVKSREENSEEEESEDEEAEDEESDEEGLEDEQSDKEHQDVCDDEGSLSPILLRGDGDHTMNYDPEIDDWLEWNQERMEHEERILSGRLDDSLSSPITPGDDINPNPDSESSSSHLQYDDTTTAPEVSATASAPELRALSLSAESQDNQQEPLQPQTVAVSTAAATPDATSNEPNTVESLPYSRFYDCAAPLLVEQPGYPHFRTDAQQRAIPLTVHIEGHPIARAHVIDSGTSNRPGQLSIRFVGSVFDEAQGSSTIPRAYVVLRHVANDKESGTTISGVYLSRSRAMKAAMGLFDQRVSSQGFAIPLHTGYRWQPGLLGYGYELTAWKGTDNARISSSSAGSFREVVWVETHALDEGCGVGSTDKDEGSIGHEEVARSYSAEQGQADGDTPEEQGADQDRYADEPEHATDAERAQNPAEGGEEEVGSSAEETQKSNSQWTAQEKLSMLMMS
ncbi:hypothetical protein LTR56_006142 [Elasticomyces elasticus]|nr:hypothetical protein LTR56_006142 [Elasticomyces elasticus]KAK3667588.1 hypothetical protein LTR22_001403 [Elasticomyces elasticus]KAK4928455.1 hypothetical protein LTR49_004862 [Elasticomyces elasticus]KAK5767256.1 hypothetical protein LTS12_002714 [Elasticomyces elasticus]